MYKKIKGEFSKYIAKLMAQHKKIKGCLPNTINILLMCMKLFLIAKNAACTFTPQKPIEVGKLKEYVLQHQINKDRGFIDEFRV